MTDALAPETELDPFGGEVDLGAALSERVLNQDEIDSLLGFDMGGGDDAERSGIRLKTGSMPNVHLLVDRLQMEVVLRNLLSNAFDAVSDSPRQPRRIWVAAMQEANGRICLRVEDSGPGLSARLAALRPQQAAH